MLHHPKLASAAILTLSAVCLAVNAQETAKPANQTAARLEKLWVDLASPDEIRATRAALALAAMPKDAVPFLKEHLKAVKIDANEIAKLVKRLDSDEFEVREAAFHELEYFGKYAKPLLEKHMAEVSQLGVKKYLRDLIDKVPVEEKTPPPPPKLMGRSVSVRTNGNGEITIIIDGKPLDLTMYAPKPPPPPNLRWVRAARAAMVLEHLATPEARHVLETVAGGEPEAAPTKAAKEALERLK